MDKAAVLNYARLKNRDGLWIGCECVFTVVYEVLVACTSIYRGDAKNERMSLPTWEYIENANRRPGRAAEAPAIRRLFASSPRDPRYHMLEHLSSKFRTPPQASLLEPRAALILNRFTRTLTVMYATNAVSSILGVMPEQFKDRSFYECIQENCLPDAIRCLESAKANDSIAYLRFWYRDPRRQEDFDNEMREASQSSDSEDGGVELNDCMDVDKEVNEYRPSGQETFGNDHISPDNTKSNSRTSPGESTDLDHDAANTIFDQAQPSNSSTTSSLLVLTPEERHQQRRRPTPAPRLALEPYELEAVVSCTSDGLVVVLRRARPPIPNLEPPRQVQHFANGLFAAPWGANPIRPHLFQPNPQFPFQHGLQAPQHQSGGPPLDEFMNSIREVAVFAWSLTGINGNIASYGHGVPRGEAQPPWGLPIWDPYGQPSPGYHPPENQAAQKWSQLATKANEPANGNEVSFQHPHEEPNFRLHNGYGADPMGSDHQASTTDAPVGHHLAYAYQPRFQGNQVDNLFGHVQEQNGLLTGTSAGPSAGGNNNQSLQSRSPQGPSEGTRSNRYMWY